MLIKENEPLAPYTTFKIGGPADHFVEITTVEELKEAIAFAEARNMPLTVIGGGSDLLISDDGIRGLVIRMRGEDVSYDDRGAHVLVSASAGKLLDALIAETTLRGLWGLENLSKIPHATVGGAVVQNAGAYGVELGELVVSVDVYDRTARTVRTLTREACRFMYRDSVFKHTEGKSYIVVGATLCLSTIPKPNIAYKDLAAVFQDRVDITPREVRRAVSEIRERKFPDLARCGTAGSFFTNPIISEATYRKLCERYPGMPGMRANDGYIKVPLAWILDTVLHLKGARAGDVGAWESQPLVLVNYGSASAADVDVFASKIEKKVFDATGIMIEREVHEMQ